MLLPVIECSNIIECYDIGGGKRYIVNTKYTDKCGIKWYEPDINCYCYWTKTSTTK